MTSRRRSLLTQSRRRRNPITVSRIAGAPLLLPPTVPIAIPTDSKGFGVSLDKASEAHSRASPRSAGTQRVAKPAPPLGSASDCRSQVSNPNCGWSRFPARLSRVAPKGQKSLSADGFHFLTRSSASRPTLVLFVHPSRSLDRLVMSTPHPNERLR